jgi:hypothetical protein
VIVAISTWDQIRTILLAAAVIAGAITALWAFKPTQWVMRSFSRLFIKPINTGIENKFRTVIKEETEDIRKQVFPNGGSSLSDKMSRTELQVEMLNVLIQSVHEKLDVIGMTTENVIITQTGHSKNG